MTKTETLAIKVTPEDKEKIKRMAEERDVTVSKLLYKMLIENIQEVQDERKGRGID